MFIKNERAAIIMLWDILTQTSSLTGLGAFVGGYIKSSQLNRHEIEKMKTKGYFKLQEETRKDKSVSSIVGRFVLVGSVLFMIFYMIVITLAKNIPLTLETVQTTSWFGHLFYGPTHMVYKTLRGAVIPSWMPTILIGAMGFWFGSMRLP